MVVVTAYGDGGDDSMVMVVVTVYGDGTKSVRLAFIKAVGNTHTYTHTGKVMRDHHTCTIAEHICMQTFTSSPPL